jgi:anti-sigma factor RsiW
MTPDECRTIAPLLVDYADRELTDRQAAAVNDHLRQCPDCQNTLRALEKSLHLAHVVWNNDKVLLDKPFYQTRAAQIAAGLLVALTAALLANHLRTRPSSPPPPRSTVLAGLQDSAARQAAGAELLWAAQLLAENPETHALAQEQFHYIVRQFPETPAAQKARRHMKRLAPDKPITSRSVES